MLVSKMSFSEAFFIEIIGGDQRDQMLDLKIAQFSPQSCPKRKHISFYSRRCFNHAAKCLRKEETIIIGPGLDVENQRFKSDVD